MLRLTDCLIFGDLSFAYIVIAIYLCIILAASTIALTIHYLHIFFRGFEDCLRFVRDIPIPTSPLMTSFYVITDVDC